jgi:uncharacterized membrane protein YkvA (DUF1232 family)
MNVYEWYRNTLRNPKYRWWIVIGTLAYLFSPIDIAPDFFPLIGQIDDIAVVTLLVAELSQILIDRLKAAKGDKTAHTTETAADSPSATSPQTTAPVDVEAVSVE